MVLLVAHAEVAVWLRATIYCSDLMKNACHGNGAVFNLGVPKTSSSSQTHSLTEPLMSVALFSEVYQIRLSQNVTHAKKEDILATEAGWFLSLPGHRAVVHKSKHHAGLYVVGAPLAVDVNPKWYNTYKAQYLEFLRCDSRLDQAAQAGRAASLRPGHCPSIRNKEFLLETHQQPMVGYGSVGQGGSACGSHCRHIAKQIMGKWGMG